MFSAAHLPDENMVFARIPGEQQLPPRLLTSASGVLARRP